MVDEQCGMGSAEGVARTEHRIESVQVKRFQSHVRAETRRGAPHGAGRAARAHGGEGDRQLHQATTAERVAEAAFPTDQRRVRELARQRARLKATGLKRLVIAGGVSANRRLRQSLEKMAAGLNGELFYARPQFCTDNGAMIAYAGCRRLMAGQQDEGGLSPRARWPLEELPAIVS